MEFKNTIKSKLLYIGSCQHYGIDTSDYSFGYVAGWSSDKDAPELNASLKTIQKTAHAIIGSIDERLAELEQEQQQAQEQTAEQEPKTVTEPNADLNIKVGEWYKQEFPTDELGAEINGDITFQQLYDGLADKDTYDMLGVNDSVVRERCFEKLADMKQVDYSEIYDKWSQSFEQPPKQEQPTAEPKQEPQKTADEFQELSDADAEKAAKMFEQKDNFAEAPTVADLEQKNGNSVEYGNYNLIYSAELKAGETPETLFEKFNTDIPHDFKGHSMSVSDILVLRQNGQEQALYCDRVGFREVPEFLSGKANVLDTARRKGNQLTNKIDKRFSR